jgi:hypothetical protein
VKAHGMESWLAAEATARSGMLRQGLRVRGGETDVFTDGTPGALVRIDPRDGSVCVFRDTPVVAHFSRPLDPTGVTAQTFRVQDDQGPVPGRLRLSPDASVLIWEPAEPLAAYVHHFVVSSGLRDARGRELTTHLSRFLTCDLMQRDISG